MLNWSPTEEKSGEDRLGQQSILSNFGATNILAFLLFAGIFLILRLLIFVFRRSKNQKWHEKALKINKRILYNPLIQYVIFEAMKLQLASLVSLNSRNTTIGDQIAAYLLLAFITFVPLAFFFILCKNHSMLDLDSSRERFGKLYFGKNVQKERLVLWMPLTFFYRRSIFILTSIYFIKHTNLQMVIIYALSLLTLIYLAHDSQFFENRWLRLVEVGTETLFFYICIFFQQHLDIRNDELA